MRIENEPRRLGRSDLARQRLALLKSLRSFGIGIDEARLGARRDLAGECFAVTHFVTPLLRRAAATGLHSLILLAFSS